MRATEEVSVSPLSYLETLRSLRMSRDKAISDQRKHMDGMLLNKLENLPEMVNMVSNDVLSPADPIVYHLCGYLVFKRAKFTNCENCWNTMEDKNELPAQSCLTAIKNLGSLKFPSKVLYDLIRNDVEPVFANLDCNDYASRCLVEKIIERVHKLHCNGIGCCQDHSESLTVQIVTYYITLRLFFIANNYNHERLSSRKRSHDKNKESKLL